MLIFGTGVVIGALVARQTPVIRGPHQQRQPPAAASRQPLPISPSNLRLEFLRRAELELNLTPEQHEKVDRLIKDSQARMRKLMEPVAPQMNQAFEKTRDEFRSVLTPEQLAKFDQLSRQPARPRDPHRPGGAAGRATEGTNAEAVAPAPTPVGKQ